MRHHIFAESDSYKVALLVKPTAFTKSELVENYINPLVNLGLKQEDIIAFTLDQGEGKKPTAKEIKNYLDTLLPSLASLGVQYLYITDTNYFKTLTKEGKTDPHLGYLLNCAVKDYTHLKIVLGINHQQLIYNPDLKTKLDTSLSTLASAIQGTYQDPGSNIIHYACYPKTNQEITNALDSLHVYPSLSCDIESFSLMFTEAGIGSITFCWDEHNGIAFAVDYKEVEQEGGLYGVQVDNTEIKYKLAQFFETYQGKLTFHNASFDVKVLIYNLWMRDPLDIQGLLEGLEVMTRNLDDTKIIAYLAYNSTAGNQLGLKTLAHEFAGNWAQEDIKDIRRIRLKELLQYNLVDGLSTNYIKKRDYPIMVRDNQEELYKGLMLDSLKLIIQIELCGMPMDMTKVVEAKEKLEQESQTYLATINNSPLIAAFNVILQTEAMNTVNAKLKIKQHPLEKFKDISFNPNSGPQLQKLLYDFIGLPVLDLTESKKPATGSDAIEKLCKHIEDTGVQELLNALVKYSGINKILTAFIPSFEKALLKSDGSHYLHGGFNIGGTVSGRLSSSKPNLQQLPSGSTYGKLIKKCFKAPKGWLFVGADFNSLEDYISALTTQDPNKLGVYINGFDGHCLRAAYYFRDELPHIDLTDPKSVNSIKKTHAHLRQESKAPTFALTYQGTAHTLMTNLGWSEEKAKSVEANYHELYKVSDQYVQDRLAQASKDGYVEVAFGLRVRTPLLAQVMWGTSRVPYEAQAEGRTAGNALGQSYGLLNNRAAVAFMKKVWDSPYRYDIKPVALIHDAIYLVIKDDLHVVDWVNRHLIQEMRWQELPEIQHDTVKLGAALDIFWPDWSNAITLPNDSTKEVIKELCTKVKNEFTKP